VVCPSIIVNTLDLSGVGDGIDLSAQEEYVKLFSQPLLVPQIATLAALFGWSLPDNFGVVGMQLLI
jgi:hypothetical protein